MKKQEDQLARAGEEVDALQPTFPQSNRQLLCFEMRVSG